MLVRVPAVGEQDPHFEPYGDLDGEREEYAARVDQAAQWFLKLPDAIVHRIHELTVRCPVRGCGLGGVFRIALRSGGTRYFFWGITSGGKYVPGFLNWAFSDD